MHGCVWKWGQQVGGKAYWPYLGGSSGETTIGDPPLYGVKNRVQSSVNQFATKYPCGTIDRRLREMISHWRILEVRCIQTRGTEKVGIGKSFLAEIRPSDKFHS